jgi:AraC-like DNA-binding protein
VFVTRWDDSTGTSRREAAPPSARFVLAVSLRAVRARIWSDDRLAFDGRLTPGTLWLTAPGEAVAAEFEGPCAFVHVHIAQDDWRTWLASFGQAAAGVRPEPVLAHDSLAESLARSLVARAAAASPAYARAVAEALIGRRLSLALQAPADVHALPQWRLRKVQTHIEDNLAEPIRLADLARIAGLSRMHFAAQFRAATGYRPHEYLLWRRIEAAKAMLRRAELPIVQVALEVGFQAQAHFSTVFKRLTGDTPAAWRVAHAEGVSA